MLKSVPTTIGEIVNDQGKHWGAIVSNTVIADHLLDNGVIVLPCKIGDTVYCIRPYNPLDHDQIVKGTVWRIVYEGENGIFVLTENGVWRSDEVFMSRRDAIHHIETFIQKLKEMIE